MTKLEMLHKKWSRNPDYRAAYDALEDEFVPPLEVQIRSAINGAGATTMTAEQMRAARALGQSASDFERIRHEAKAGIEPAIDEDSPDASELIRTVKDQRRP